MHVPPGGEPEEDPGHAGGTSSASTDYFALAHPKTDVLPQTGASLRSTTCRSSAVVAHAPRTPN